MPFPREHWGMSSSCKRSVTKGHVKKAKLCRYPSIESGDAKLVIPEHGTATEETIVDAQKPIIGCCDRLPRSPVRGYRCHVYTHIFTDYWLRLKVDNLQPYRNQTLPFLSREERKEVRANMGWIRSLPKASN